MLKGMSSFTKASALDYSGIGMKRFVLIFIIISMPIRLIFSMGADDNRTYEAQLATDYPIIIDSLTDGQITAAEAKEHLARLRESNDISYNDEAGMLDSFVDQLDEGLITKDQALLYFTYLKENRISELRKEEGSNSVLSYQKELMTEFKLAIDHLSSHEISIDEAIVEMERYQRNSGFLKSDMYDRLQTLLQTYKSGDLNDLQLQSSFDDIRSEWQDSNDLDLDSEMEIAEFEDQDSDDIDEIDDLAEAEAEAEKDDEEESEDEAEDEREDEVESEDEFEEVDEEEEEDDSEEESDNEIEDDLPDDDI